MTDPTIVGPLQLQRLALGQVSARMSAVTARVPSIAHGGGQWAGPARDAYNSRLHELARLAAQAHDAVLVARDCVDRAIATVVNDVR